MGKDNLSSSEGYVALAIKDDKISVKSEAKNLNITQLSMMLAHLKLMSNKIEKILEGLIMKENKKWR